MTSFVPSTNEAGPSTHRPAPTYTVGHRYLHFKSRQPLTIRYIGPLPPRTSDLVQYTTSSAHLWIGVEYDDPAYGKGHSGTYEGYQVFDCVQHGAGAFIKLPTNAGAKAWLMRGQSLISAIEDRYGAILPSAEAVGSRSDHERSGLPTSHDKDNGESLVLGSSNSTIKVEMPNMASVRQRVGQLEKLKNMGFDEDFIDSVGGEGNEELRAALRERLKGLKWLNLSKNLLSSWVGVREIVSYLEGLQILSLNYSRLQPLSSDILASDLQRYQTTFARIKELHLSACLLMWEEVRKISYLFPNLEVLHLEDNSPLRPLSSGEGLFDNLRELNLARCPITDWAEVVSALAPLPKLDSLDLSWSELGVIPPLMPGVPPFTELKQLNLHQTLLTIWVDVDHLNEWTSSNLASLRLSRRDVSLDVDDADSITQSTNRGKTTPSLLLTGTNSDRPIAIAKFPSLTSFNSTGISLPERRDAEMYYTTYVGQYLREHRPKEEWGRYKELCAKHGRIEEKPSRLHIYPTPRTSISINSGETINVLPSSKKALLQRKIARLVGIKTSGDIQLWTVKEREVDEGTDHRLTVKGVEGQVLEPAVHVTADGDEEDVGWWFDDGDNVMISTTDEVEALLLART